MSKIFLATGAFFFATQLVAPAYAYPVPLTKEECLQMKGTAWDEAQEKTWV